MFGGNPEVDDIVPGGRGWGFSCKRSFRKVFTARVSFGFQKTAPAFPVWKAGAGGLGCDFSGQVPGKKLRDALRLQALAQGPHQLGHGGLAGHVPALDDAQLQELPAHLVHLQIRAVVETLGGHHPMPL